ncbi:hypothetical protein BT96DRAFT_968003 [Gymnopus androsaceus JB14]|uniref:GDP-mannose transporter n=1 Tax=Gymnopus androsaceus JB14 TaxID=1447944 RepID=A0A6A4GW18_9AGAR|nr:hypothetical protein BT96DRAFT_968003 [Gymnopus androsaceus JB14]
MSPQNAQNSKLLVTGVVVFYLVAALSVSAANILSLNKWVLNVTDAPLFFLFTQLVIAVILFMVSDTLRLLPDRLTLDINICKGLVPMVGLSVVGLSFSNYTLKYVDASFYQVARGLVLPFTVCASFFFLNARPSPLILIACGLVTMGFFVGVSAITAIHSIVIKRSLPVVNGSALLLSWYTNLLSAVVLIPIIVVAGETPAVFKLFFQTDDQMSALRTFVWGSAITGLLGFLMSIASLLSIKVTSPITHMVSSAVRGVAASLLGMWYFHDVITTGRASSIAIILLGSMYYTWVKHVESQSPAPPATTGASYERVKMEDVESGVRRSSNSKPE